MRVFKTRQVAKLADRARVSDPALMEAVRKIERGLIDAPLGRFLVKQRVARPGEGKSGGFRTVLFYRARDKAVFLYLFAKNEKANLAATELRYYRDFADDIAALSWSEIDTAVAERRWIEIGE